MVGDIFVSYLFNRTKHMTGHYNVKRKTLQLTQMDYKRFLMFVIIDEIRPNSWSTIIRTEKKFIILVWI
jgi:hypothetical protein